MDANDIERLADMYEQGATEAQRMHGRAMRAFNPVILWWVRELGRARSSADPQDHFHDMVNMLAYQLSAVISSSLSGADPGMKRAVIAAVVSLLEDGSPEDLLPSRDEIPRMDLAARSGLN